MKDFCDCYKIFPMEHCITPFLFDCFLNYPRYFLLPLIFVHSLLPPLPYRQKKPTTTKYQAIANVTIAITSHNRPFTSLLPPFLAYKQQKSEESVLPNSPLQCYMNPLFPAMLSLYPVLLWERNENILSFLSSVFRKDIHNSSRYLFE